jgi:hypothetical protein
LTAVALKSKAEGNLLWGRIQGTQYEREAADWVQAKLQEFGFEDIRKDTVPARRPLWWLDELELTVVAAPGFSSQQEYRFVNALTAYQSATTPRGGIEAELVYVGEGSPAELQGRDLAGKVVLLRSRGLPGSLFHSARVAFSRLATLEKKPTAVIVWPDVPGASQVAARVGSVGGGENIGLALPWTTINIWRTSTDSCTRSTVTRVPLRSTWRWPTTMRIFPQRIAPTAISFYSWVITKIPVWAQPTSLSRQIANW